MKAKLPLLPPDIAPLDFEDEAKRTYASVLNGGVLDGNSKLGPDEAKVKMNIKSGSLSAKVIGEAIEKKNEIAEIMPPAPESGVPSPQVALTQLTTEAFFKACEEVFLVYLDSR